MIASMTYIRPKVHKTLVLCNRIMFCYGLKNRGVIRGEEGRKRKDENEKRMQK
jgi:hypothetical protein